MIRYAPDVGLLSDGTNLESLFPALHWDLRFFWHLSLLRIVLLLRLTYPLGSAWGFPCSVAWTIAMYLGFIFRPEMFCPFDTAHIETAISRSLTLLVWCIIHFHHFKYHDPYNDSHMLTLCIHPWQLGGCGYRLSALSHCFTPFITYRAFRGRDITNGYDSVKTHFKQRPSGRTYMVLAFPPYVW